MQNLKIFKSFTKSKFTSMKYPHYFHVYEMLFAKYKNKKIKFVEIGVLDGGSLFMWRDYLGKDAEIIGIDLNPDAKRWEKNGFKIFIGDQSSNKFWIDFYKKVGNIDVLLDDGGHTSKQQIVTLNCSINNVNDNGLIVVEDTHSNYMFSYGNPSFFSFINYSKKLCDLLNKRFFTNPKKYNFHQRSIFAINFFDSIVAFHVNKKLCVKSKLIFNNGIKPKSHDYRYDSSVNYHIVNFRLYLKEMSKTSVIFKLIYKIVKRPLRFFSFIILKIENFKLIFEFLRIKK